MDLTVCNSFEFYRNCCCKFASLWQWRDAWQSLTTPKIKAITSHKTDHKLFIITVFWETNHKKNAKTELQALKAFLLLFFFFKLTKYLRFSRLLIQLSLYVHTLLTTMRTNAFLKCPRPVCPFWIVVLICISRQIRTANKKVPSVGRLFESGRLHCFPKHLQDTLVIKLIHTW